MPYQDKRLTMHCTTLWIKITDILGTYSKNYKNRVKIYHWYWQAMKKSGKLKFYIVHICHMYGRWEVNISARFYFSALIILAQRCIGQIKLNKCTKVNFKRKYSNEHLSRCIIFFGQILIHLWWASLLFQVMVTSLCYCGNTFFFNGYMAPDTEATENCGGRFITQQKVMISDGHCAILIITGNTSVTLVKFF